MFFNLGGEDMSVVFCGRDVSLGVCAWASGVARVRRARVGGHIVLTPRGRLGRGRWQAVISA